MNWFGRTKKAPEHSAVSSTTGSRPASSGRAGVARGGGGGGAATTAIQTNTANTVVALRESINTNEKR